MLIVDPTFTPPPPATVLTAPDGIVSAKVDAANAGVLLKADFSAAADLPERVRFVRGDGLVVRSGDPAWAPAGIAVAYDHEARPGQANSYYAVPIYPDDSEGDASQTVAVGVPWSVDDSQVWLKCPTDAGISLCLRAATFAEDGRPFRTSVTPIIGSALPMSTADLTGGLSGTLTVRTDTKAEYDAVLRLFAAGDILLVQAHPDLGGIPEMYVRPMDRLASQRMVETGYGWGKRSWAVQVSEVRRPSTTGAPLMIPGLSYDSVDAQYASYEDRAAQVPSYLALLGW